MGWDVLSAGQELQSETMADGGTVRQENRVHTQQRQQQHQHQHEHQQQSLDAKSSWASFKLPSLQQITTFGRIFITNAILGMAVFSMYEGMIEYFDANPSIATETEEIDNNFKTREQLNDNTAYATISASQPTKISIIDEPSLHHPSTSTNAGIEEDVKIQCDNSSSNYTTITRVQKDNTINLKNDGDATYSEDDAMERASIAQHLVAGALGGATHAILSLALESNFHLTTIIGANTTAIESVGKNHGTANYLRLPQFIQSMMSFVRHSKHNVLRTAATVTATNTKKPTFLSLQFPSMNYATSSILHHSIAHSMLFGSYQFTKRSLFHLAFTDSEHTMATKDLEEDAATLKTNRDIIHATTIAAAGGFAGQIQHVTSHFTEQWFGLGDVMVDNGHRRSLSWNNALVRRLVMVSWPSWRSTMMAFPPSAVGFLAFEYGKLMMMGEETLDGVS